MGADGNRNRQQVTDQGVDAPTLGVIGQIKDFEV